MKFPLYRVSLSLLFNKLVFEFDFKDREKDKHNDDPKTRISLSSVLTSRRLRTEIHRDTLVWCL